MKIWPQIDSKQKLSWNSYKPQNSSQHDRVGKTRVEASYEYQYQIQSMSLLKQC